MIEKIGNLYYDTWKPGMDGNVHGQHGIVQTLTLSNRGGIY